MSNRHFDVVILGRSLGALTCAALLARRDFRVLLLGQGEQPASYHFDRHTLKRRTFTLLFGSSPVWRRVLHDLAQTQTFRRRIQPLDPMFAFLGERQRLEIPPDGKQFSREIEREFPQVKQLVDELYGRFADINASTDAALERDAVWPPGTFWERLETGRIASQLPLSGQDGSDDLLGKFPADHPYRDLTLLPSLFASDLDDNGRLPPLALARLHGSWTRGVYALPGGADDLESFLVERTEAHGGQCRMLRRAERIVVRRGKIAGIVEDGEEEATGADALVSTLPGEHLAELSAGQGITKYAQRDWPQLTATAGRFVVSLIVKTEALPVALAPEAFLMPPHAERDNPRYPPLHVQRVEAGDYRGTKETLLVAECILRAGGKLDILEARDAILNTLRSHFPFLDQHVVLIDSVHDGLPLYDYATGQRREIDRVHVPETAPEAEPMQWLWACDPQGFLGLAGEPVRGPISGSYLAGKTVLPALGQEGELLAAWSAAKLITRQDSARQRRRRQMWSKIDTI